MPTTNTKNIYYSYILIAILKRKGLIVLNFTCERTKLVEALSNVQRAVSPKSNLAALEGVFISAENSQLKLCGYNTEIAIKTSIDATVLNEGKIVLSAKLFTDIIRRLPAETVTIETKERLTVSIKSGLSEFSLVGISAEEFPEVPEIENPDSINLPVQIAKSMIKQTIFAVADIDTKPVHTGTLFDIKKNEIKLVSVDGYRMAVRTEEIKENLEIRFVVPGKALGEVLKLLPDGEDKTLQIFAGQRHIMFNTGEYCVISRLLEGEFLDYEVSIPEKFKTRVSVNTRLMLESVERVSLLINERLKSPVRCNISTGFARLSCFTAIGKAFDEFPIKTEGEDIEIGFNSKYMMDALRNSDTDEVIIEINGSLSPIKILPKEGKNFLFLVLPVRLRAQ